MFNNYSAHVGILTREVGRIYWKKALESECPLEIFNNRVYMDFSQDAPGWYMYNFPPTNIGIGQTLKVECDFALYTGSNNFTTYLGTEGGIRFGLFNSNNNPVNIDGLSNTGQIFCNYEGYATTLSPDSLDPNALQIRIRTKDPNGTIFDYGRLINSVGAVCYGNGAVAAETSINTSITGVNNPLEVRDGESVNNQIFYYKFKQTINRTSLTGSLITLSILTGSLNIGEVSYTHNFTGNYDTFDNFVFRCNGDMVDQAIIQNLKISLSSNFWDIPGTQAGQSLQGFKVIYSSGNVIADWGDGNTSGITSNVNYNYTWSA